MPVGVKTCVKLYGRYTVEQWAEGSFVSSPAITSLARDLIEAQVRIAELETELRALAVASPSLSKANGS